MLNLVDPSQRNRSMSAARRTTRGRDYNRDRDRTHPDRLSQTHATAPSSLGIEPNQLILPALARLGE